MNSVIEKEISESMSSVASQHSQCQLFVQTFLLSVTGLFAVAAFFSKDSKLTLQASSVGIVYSLLVFFMGWVFLSVIAHKVAMIHILYKHIAAMRAFRVSLFPMLRNTYVLPIGRATAKYGSMINQLPYLFFAFNFVLFAGALSFFLAPHIQYHQNVAVVIAVCTVLGTFYPIVCISFNKHLECARRAKDMLHKERLEKVWTQSVRSKKRKFRWPRILFLILCNFGAIAIAVLSFDPSHFLSSRQIIAFSYGGALGFIFLRYAVEKWRIRIGIESISNEEK
ncbi:hypothetical protein [Undibacterium sp. Ji22W]|uniref:hypothetical protein n=1 Tax=Undibacterium sp. Ji22W TaxID=3413038 RepID=UPI003BEFF1CF